MRIWPHTLDSGSSSCMTGAYHTGRAVLASLAGLAASCTPPASGPAAIAPQVEVAPAAPPAVPAPAPAGAPCASLSLAGKALLTTHEARCLMVSLINRDRATMNLPPVELDEGPPTLAG